ncbi:MAG TPA: DUF3857 domain-containing protein [candidate division Zixibacteria bacterium]|nr:DUF3857 domain-containing protein [candidate division Zixibacteria bacterium]
MRRALIILTAIIMTAFIFQTANAQKSIDGKYDIAVLMDSARANFNLEEQDGVFLLDSKEVRWLTDGRMSTTIHRIIWIGTDYAVDKYGDHRIPYDDEHQGFETITVRTWRDDQWWVTGATGMVETLPHALRNAYDYTNMREMMLLHNGIEIPCILEVAYTITDKEPYRKNIDGMWVFQKELPVVVSSISIGTRDGVSPRFQRTPNLPEFSIMRDDGADVDMYVLSLGPFDALPYPDTEENELISPKIAWSTWDNWKELGEYYDGIYRQSMTLDNDLEAAADSIIKEAMNKQQCAEMMADFIRKKTGYISYSYKHWMQYPRPAVRTYECAYGHTLDRMILAAAFFEKADLIPEFLFLGKGLIKAGMQVASADFLTRPLVQITGDYGRIYYDPESGALIKGKQAYYGHTAFHLLPEQGKNLHTFAEASEKSRLALRIDLALNDSKDTLKGQAYLETSGIFSPYDQMAGTKEETENYLSTLISEIIPEAQLKSHNLLHFEAGKCDAAFGFALQLPEKDEFGEIKLVLNNPPGGIMSKMPGHVHLYEKSRGSQIYLPGPMLQEIGINLDTTGIEIIYWPEDSQIKNTIGSFAVKSETYSNRLKTVRTTDIAEVQIMAEQWPVLRDLLLSETDQKNRMFIFKIKDDSDKKGD